MSWYTKREAEAITEVEKLLALPTMEYEAPSEGEFDPWEIFPFYGNYSSEFDDMAITTLENLLRGEFKDKGLAHEMFREVLCKKNLCDYGTSPRVCFPTQGFKKLLPELIEKWKQYYKTVWDEPFEEETEA